LPSEHCELVAQDEQLDVFGELAPPSSNKQPQHSRECEVGEGKQHFADALMAPPPTACTVEPGF
jgi:hypothetical protein